MYLEHWNIRKFESSLEEALTHCYSVQEIGVLYNDILLPARGQKPLLKIPRKGSMVRELVQTLNSIADGRRFFEACSPNLRSVLGVLAWDGDLPLEQLEKMVGFPISAVETVKPTHRYERERFSVNILPEFLAVALAPGNPWDYGAASSKAQLVARLPPALRSCLRKVMPPPAGYDFEPVEQPPEGALTYRCDETVQEDLRMVADYINRGHLQRLGSGKIKKSCVRALCEMTRGGEFFCAAATPKSLEFLRTTLFADLLAGADGEIRKAMVAEPPDPEVIFRGFLATTLKNSPFVHAHLLSHIKSFNPFCEYLAATPKNLWAIFCRMSSTGWVTVENLLKYQDYREIPLDFIRNPYCSVTVDLAGGAGSYRRRQRLNLLPANQKDFLITPMLQGMAFLLAAMGFAEIAYTVPKNPRWQRGGEDFLTFWDGLCAVRLTPLGAYAFKQTDALVLSAAPRKRAEIFLNPNRLTVTSRNIDPVTELTLLDFMEKLCDGCYRMTRKSFLRGCTTDDYVQRRINQFKANIAGDPPPVWQKFLDQLSGGVVALRCRSSYKVYALTDTPELRRLFATDPVLKKKTLKVEGLSVAITKKELPAVAQRLAEFGYLL